MGGLINKANQAAMNSPMSYFNMLKPTIDAKASDQSAYNASQNQIMTLLGQAPTDMPDLTDPAVRQAHAAAKLNAQLGETRQSTFLGGGQGLPSYGQKTLLGG